MEPTFFYIGLYFLVSFLQIASSRVDNYGGWNSSPDTQYHIQTDEGEERYFKYQTKTGQYRKEKRLQDGTVVGTYGWVDPNGFLRLRDYVADNGGYRIVKTKMVYVGGPTLTDKTVAAVRNYPSTYSTIPPSSTPLQSPFDLQSHRFAYIPPSTYHPAPPAALLSRTTPYLPPQTSLYPQTQTTFIPSSFRSTPASTFLRRPGEPSPLLHPEYYSSSTPIVDVSPNSIPRSSTPLYAAPSNLSPTVSPFANTVELSSPRFLSTTPDYSISHLSSTPTFFSTTPDYSNNHLSSTPSYPSSTSDYSSSTPSYPSSYPSSTPHYPSSSPGYASSASFPVSSTPRYDSSTPSPISSTTARPPPSSTPHYPSSSGSPSVAIFNDPAPTPIAVYSSTPSPIAVNYVSTPSPSASQPIKAIGYTVSEPATSLIPPVAGKFLPNNNFITETEKNKLFFRHLENRNDYRKRYADYYNNIQEYDGISTVQNGFRYFLPRQYHEEQSSSDGQNRAGSFGYIDPFGIRRVIYYNTSPEGGFVHRKNNRYVGFDSTPYDPRPL